MPRVNTKDILKIPGLGVQNLSKVVSALKEAGYKEALSVEIWGLNPEEIAAKSIGYLSRMILGGRQ